MMPRTLSAKLTLALIAILAVTGAASTLYGSVANEQRGALLGEAVAGASGA
ncbi:MAG: hypothetical protein ABFS30_10515 [Pseudomonadota bacterium]